MRLRQPAQRGCRIRLRCAGRNDLALRASGLLVAGPAQAVLRLDVHGAVNADDHVGGRNVSGANRLLPAFLGSGAQENLE